MNGLILRRRCKTPFAYMHCQHFIRLGIVLYSLSLSKAATVDVSKVDIGAGPASSIGQTLAPGDILYYQVDPSPNGYDDSLLVFRTLGGFLFNITFLPAISADGGIVTGNFAIPSCQSGHYLVSIDSQNVMSGDTPELAIILGQSSSISVPLLPTETAATTNTIPNPTSSTVGTVVPSQNSTPTPTKSNASTSPTTTNSQVFVTHTGSNETSNPNKTTTSNEATALNETTDLQESTLTQGNTNPHETNSPNNSESPLPDPEVPSETNKNLPRTKLVGIIVGALGLLIIIIIATSICIFRKKRSRQQSGANSNTNIITVMRKTLARRPTEIVHPYDSQATPSAIPPPTFPPGKKNELLPAIPVEDDPHNQVSALTEVIGQRQDRIKRIEERSDFISTPISGRITTSSFSRGTDEPPPTYFDTVSSQGNN